MNNVIAQLSSETAKNLLQRQQIHGNNLANSQTTGFKADLDYVVDGELKTGSFMQVGHGRATGRDTDLAIIGEGWFVVQNKEGKEAYTRAGDFVIDGHGFLKTGTGLEVMGTGGPIALPAFKTMDIAQDGSISILPADATEATERTTIGRIKCVNPATRNLIKGDDGLFYMRHGSAAEHDASVTVQSGYLEESNVNTIAVMTQMIDASRHFEMQLKMLRALKENDEAESKIIERST
jgi:flagellar basal-body rod protein FlgF